MNGGWGVSRLNVHKALIQKLKYHLKFRMYPQKNPQKSRRFYGLIKAMKWAPSVENEDTWLSHVTTPTPVIQHWAGASKLHSSVASGVWFLTGDGFMPH